MYASLHAEKDSLIAFVDTRENRTGFTPGLKSRRNDRLKADYFMSAFNRIGTLLVFGARATLLSSLFTWSQPPIAPAQISLAYGHRSNPDRQEGLIQPETSGRLSVRLVSAEMLFDAFEATQSDQIHVRFLLQKPCEATISVRELQPYHLYAMDASVPETVAHTGWNNEFAWPTREVLKALPDLQNKNKLGVVVRLGKATMDETVAPAILYHTKLPDTVSKYIFRFIPTLDSSIQYEVFTDGKALPVFSRTLPGVGGGIAFPAIWDSEGAAEGFYRLVVHATSLTSGKETLDHTVRFYHSKFVKR